MVGLARAELAVGLNREVTTEAAEQACPGGGLDEPRDQVRFDVVVNLSDSYWHIAHGVSFAAPIVASPVAVDLE